MKHKMSPKSFRNVILKNKKTFLFPTFFLSLLFHLCGLSFLDCAETTVTGCKKKKEKKSENCSRLLNKMGVIVLEFSWSYLLCDCDTKKRII